MADTKNTQSKEQAQEKQPWEDLTLSDLKAQAVELGMSKEDAELFNNKKLAYAAVESLKLAYEVGREEGAEEAQQEVQEPDEASNDDSDADKKEDPFKEDRDLNEKRETQKAWLSKAMIMREKLDKQPKIRIKLPLEGDEQVGVLKPTKINGRTEFVHVKGAVRVVQINGYKTIIPKGIYWDVPEQVADILGESDKETQAAGEKFSLDRVDPTTGRKVSQSM